ncbi:hypothetical protein LINPERPRIM_LOCUS43807 [Linum perenne]
MGLGILLPRIISRRFHEVGRRRRRRLWCWIVREVSL